MLNRLLFAGVALAFLMAATSTSQIQKTLGEIENLRWQTCELPPDKVDRLLSEVEASTSIRDKVQALQYLSSHIGWAAENHATVPDRLHKIAQGSETLALMSAQALSTARRELRTVPVPWKPEKRAEYQDFLERLIAANEGENAYYQAMAKVTLAETLQDWVFRDNKDVPLPYEAGSDAAEKLQRAQALYGELSNFYSDKWATTKLYSRDVSLDFAYQIALLQYAAGSRDWAPSLQAIINSEAVKDPYADAQQSRHIYVYSFLRPPGENRKKEVSAGSKTLSKQSCAPQARSGTSELTEYVSPAISKTFYNPVQLGLFTCQQLAAPSAGRTITTLAEDLNSFRNHDYRIVLGHYEGNDVRYSKFDLPELESRAAQLENLLTERYTPTNPLALESTAACTLPNGVAMPQTSEALAKQSEGGSQGYLYIGDGLALDDARALLDLVQSNEDFSNAYLIRPAIE